MTEPPSKRFKQRSLTEFSFRRGTKPKSQAQAAKFSKKQGIVLRTMCLFIQIKTVSLALVCLTFHMTVVLVFSKRIGSLLLLLLKTMPEY